MHVCRGPFSVVHAAVRRSTGQAYAVKVLDIAKFLATSPGLSADGVLGRHLWILELEMTLHALAATNCFFNSHVVDCGQATVNQNIYI